MDAWAAHQDVGNKVTLLADGSATFAKALGLEFDLSERGLGVRSRRYSMVVDDGTVSAFHLEDGPGVNASSAETLLDEL
jgi:peroxiredoxin